MDQRRIITIGAVVAVLLVGLVVALAMRGPAGPDCRLITKARTAGADRPVAALAPLLGDDAKAVQTALVKTAMAGIVDVALVPQPTPDFSKESVPDAVKNSETAAQAWLACGAAAVVWGAIENEGELVIEDKKSKGKNKKPQTRPVYTYLLWVTTGPDSTIQIARSKDGREAGEAVFRHWNEMKAPKPPETVGASPSGAGEGQAQPTQTPPESPKEFNKP